jgi:hypothetical protein
MYLQYIVLIYSQNKLFLRQERDPGLPVRCARGGEVKCGRRIARDRQPEGVKNCLDKQGAHKLAAQRERSVRENK